jgi:hypothetical protein
VRRFTGQLTTVHVWRVPSRAVPAALLAVAADRRQLRREPGLQFAKLLGTSRTGTFTAADATLTRWILIASWDCADRAAGADRCAAIRRWTDRSTEMWQGTLRPLSSRGRWSRRAPFAVERGERWDGPLAVVTRARLVARRAVTFWRAVPPVAADLRRQVGVGTAFGIGEAPIGVQGTFSVWRDAAALRAFAYGGSAHRQVIRRTAEMGWYAEELFARFAVLDSHGTIDGCAPLAAA